jgi:predicted RNase H-like HicB family nuclease
MIKTLRKWTIIVHEEEPEKGGYWAEVEELPGCFSSAATLDELESDAREAIGQHVRKYTAVIHEAIGCGAGYWAEVEELSGCKAFSDNLGRLAQDLQDAVEAHVRKLRAAGQPLPESYETNETDTRRWEITVAE